MSFDFTFQDLTNMNIGELWEILRMLKEQKDNTTIETPEILCTTKTTNCTTCKGEKIIKTKHEISICDSCQGKGILQQSIPHTLRVDLNDIYELVKKGHKLKIDIRYIVNEWYTAYPSNGKVNIKGYGKYSLQPFLDEIEVRETIMRLFINEAILAKNKIGYHED